jgi:hypothetical protein
MQWPGQGERLFRWDSDCHFNACINCIGPTLATVATSYKGGADALAHAARKGDATLDCVILPIVFLYRQYLELSIKDLVETTRAIEEDSSGYPKHHNLKELWTEAKRLIKQHYGEDTPPEIDYIDPCIEEFHQHDPESFSFRYPTDKKGNVNLRGLNHINLRNLYETMDRIAAFLDCIGADLGQKLEYLQER